MSVATTIRQAIKVIANPGVIQSLDHTGRCASFGARSTSVRLRSLNQ